jgi:DNA-binding MurR/RpiR family transcriptional regulator
MERDAFIIRVKQAFDDLPGRIQAAARFVLDNPHDVALLSMREQARRAEVPPATMTRLAQHLGLAGYDDIKAIHAAALRDKPEAFSERAQGLVRRHQEVGLHGVAAAMVGSLSRHVAELGQATRIEQLVDAAGALAGARRIFCLGQRSSFPAAYQFAHVLAFFDQRAQLLDAAGGTGQTSVLDIGPDDVLLVVSITPAARQVVEITAYARRRGASVIAITDSHASPAGRLAHRVVVVDSRSPSFFDTMTPAFAACEILVALIAGREARDVPSAVGETEARLRELGTWWHSDEELPDSGARQATSPEVVIRPDHDEPSPRDDAASAGRRRRKPSVKGIKS